jgi:hypothetical protein
MAEKRIRAPRNRTALMQYLQRLAMTGHVYWCGDTIVPSKLTNLVDKHGTLALRADAPARAYRKSTGRASVHLALSPDVLKASTASVDWLMLSTGGTDGLATVERPPAPVHDLRTVDGRLTLYGGRVELVHVEKTVRNGRKKTKRLTTWTWRFTAQRYKEFEALLIACAKHGDRARAEEQFRALAQYPQFAGIRTQLFALHAETNKMLSKVGLALLLPLDMPKLRILPFWAPGYEI